MPSFERATNEPNKSLASALCALMNACCDHAAPVREYTYTAPELFARLLLAGIVAKVPV
ncbi:hypothetical protein D3C71_1790880 [compost metagenome]